MARVVTISSWVAKGSVGLRAAGFALERRGHTVIAAPTVLLPWHPGLGASTRMDVTALPAQLDDLAAHAADVDAVLTGYFASAAQVEAAARLIDRVRAVRQALIVVDPVIGDIGGRYVPDAVAEAVARELIPRADVATPNRFELSDLTGPGDVAASARDLGPATVFVTSAVDAPGRSGAALVTAERTVFASHAAHAGVPSGTGDLFAGVATAMLLEGAGAEAALHGAAAAAIGVVERSSGDALALAVAQDAIAAPPLPAVEIAGEPVV